MRITSRWTSMSSPCSPAQAFPRLGAPIQALHGLALAGLCLTLTAGCRSTPEPAAETVEIELPETFSALTGEDVEIGAEPWWTTFGNESLDRAVDGVLGGNFELRGKVFGAMPVAARLTPQEARAGLKLLTPRVMLFLITLPFRKSTT